MLGTDGITGALIEHASQLIYPGSSRHVDSRKGRIPSRLVDSARGLGRGIVL